MTAAKRPIGYIGLGMMGGGMATHLLKSGYPVTVYDPREEAIEAVLELGAGLGDQDQSATIKVLEACSGVPARAKARGAR